MDETALAIARLREQAKPEKTARSERQASDDPKSPTDHTGRGSGPRKAGGTASAPSIKRSKNPGS